MPQSGEKAVNKTTAKKGGSAKKTAGNGTAARKRPTKKVGSRGSAGAGKKRASQKKRGKKNKTAWWAWPVTVFMLLILTGMGVVVAKETQNYQQFTSMRTAVSFKGFYPGVTIEGVDVSGRELTEVLNSLKSHEESLRQQVSLTLACGDKTWNITPDDLDYQTNYEEIIRSAYLMGREGTVRERYESIRQMNNAGASFAISRTWDPSLLRIITDQIAAELSWDAVDATVEDFDASTLEFTFTNASTGRYVDADKLYENALTTLNSGVGGQTLVVSQQMVEPKVTREELLESFGMVSKARTDASSSSRNRLTNIELALSSINGVRIGPGETFSFNGVVGQRTEERGYREAGAFLDGLVTQEVGGGICQVSTTLFNAIAKADLAITERQPHSRPVGYVDKGKDAAVSWPNQDFKFTNDTEFPVYLIADIVNDDNGDEWCTISVYGQKLENGMSIVIDAETTEELQPEDDRYIYTSDLPTGQKELVEEARTGYKAVAYKIYQDANGNEIRREVLCHSRYLPAGATYRVGQ